MGLLDITASNQILAIVFVTGGNDGARGHMNALSTWIESFDDFENNALATTSVNWRLRCYELFKSGLYQALDLLKFAPYDL